NNDAGYTYNMLPSNQVSKSYCAARLFKISTGGPGGIFPLNVAPFLFLHTPDIAQAPELVNTLWHDLRSVLPEIGTAPSIPQQSS
ncbi:hypothetical protein MJN76_33835, partial [Salmonella enterica subsp. enterica serovar Anatum]|nr:hypothetical protein [Salmonella enterica subsp. enterica serovar Anatum]